MLILCRGQVAYWGPVSEAVPYFERLGFRRPSDCADAEFLSALVEHPAQYFAIGMRYQ